MSKEVMKLVAEFDKRFTSMNGVDVPEKVSVPRDEWRALRDAIVQSLAQPSPVQDLHFFKQVLSVAIAGLYEHYKGDVLKTFSIRELQEVVDLSESLRPRRVEDIYKQMWVMLATSPAQPAVQGPVRIYDYVWPQRDEHKDDCVYACSYTPGHHLARGELLAVVHPSQLKNAYLQRDDEDTPLNVASLPAAQPAPVPRGMVLLPKRMTQAMRDVTDQEDWTWEDLLAAAEAITEDEYKEISTPPAEKSAPAAGGLFFDCGECPKITTGCENQCSKAAPDKGGAVCRL